MLFLTFLHGVLLFSSLLFPYYGSLHLILWKNLFKIFLHLFTWDSTGLPVSYHFMFIFWVKVYTIYAHESEPHTHESIPVICSLKDDIFSTYNLWWAVSQNGWAEDFSNNFFFHKWSNHCYIPMTCKYLISSSFSSMSWGQFSQQCWGFKSH